MTSIAIYRRATLIIASLTWLTNYPCMGQPPTSVETLDGLTLEFGTDGNVAGLRVDDRSVPTLRPPSGFFVSDMARSLRNVMPGGDFEPLAAASDDEKSRWELGNAWKIVQSADGHCARAVSTTKEGTGNMMSPRVSVESSRGYHLTARVRTSTTSEKFYPGIYVVQHDSDGQLVKVPTSDGEAVQIGVPVPRSTEDDVNVSRSFVTQPRTATVQVYANVYRTIGCFELDNVRLEPLESTPMHIEGSVRTNGDKLVFRGSAPELDLNVEATFTSHAKHIAVDGIVRDTTGRDRALRVEFRLPVNAHGWTWWDDIADSRRISSAARYANFGPDRSLGSGRHVSVFPFSSLVGNKMGLALAQRMDQPRFFRIFYDPTAGFSIDYNLGLAAETEKFPSSASFHFLIYRHDPDWGMRAAAQRYYKIFPEHFRVRARRQGLYCYNVPSDLSNLEDFGFCFDLGGFWNRDRKTLQERGIYLLSHPMGTEAQIRWPTGHDWGTQNERPSLDQIEHIIFNSRPEYQESSSFQGLTGRYYQAPFEDNRQRVVNSAVHGPDGRLRLYPYNDRIEFIATSADPEIPSPNMAEGERTYYIERHDATAASAGCELDGIDFDNIALNAGRTFENFRREHFRYVDHPLIYDFRTRRVCIQTGISFYEFVKQISYEMHAQGKLCTGNVSHVPHTQTFFGHLLDKHGGEIEYDVPTSRLRGNRMMAFQKPVSHIIYPGAVAVGQEETVMHRWLAFGHFPAITELAFSKSSDFEKGRLLYKRFMPLMQRIARAGWEPLTHAQVSGDGLLVERFGNYVDNDLYFTVHNDSNQPAMAELTIDKNTLGITAKPTWRELCSGEEIIADDQARFEVDSLRTLVFAVSRPE